ncbi:hypothetical protein HYH03_014489 [Edaphochlamys debaryana]|uniref:Uncharacterized protein n=1 Tax=Edaphochlamys debaryana TaxID=47281 RepID=A0A836BS55_9CHLO|nr:hypothetical protein HYH03_014489 [Edaphochlamys debaryana]|eukprot:KAG2486895.1 hypothetical protein HYH03_014489 [Edaphochlamys debaryana]
MNAANAFLSYIFAVLAARFVEDALYASHDTLSKRLWMMANACTAIVACATTLVMLADLLAPVSLLRDIGDAAGCLLIELLRIAVRRLEYEMRWWPTSTPARVPADFVPSPPIAVPTSFPAATPTATPPATGTPSTTPSTPHTNLFEACLNDCIGGAPRAHMVSSEPAASTTSSPESTPPSTPGAPRSPPPLAHVLTFFADSPLSPTDAAWIQNCIDMCTR